MTGNFDDNFIQKRKAKLELWLNRLSSHPVLGESEVFIHFLICDDDKWKDGKRKAENDELNGAQWMNAIDAPTEGFKSLLILFFLSKQIVNSFILKALVHFHQLLNSLINSPKIPIDLIPELRMFHRVSKKYLFTDVVLLKESFTRWVNDLRIWQMLSVLKRWNGKIITC